MPSAGFETTINQVAVASSLLGSIRDYRACVIVSSVVLYLACTMKQENDK
jgi:hypothetical protein